MSAKTERTLVAFGEEMKSINVLTQFPDMDVWEGNTLQVITLSKRPELHLTDKGRRLVAKHLDLLCEALAPTQAVQSVDQFGYSLGRITCERFTCETSLKVGEEGEIVLRRNVRPSAAWHPNFDHLGAVLDTYFSLAYGTLLRALKPIRPAGTIHLSIAVALVQKMHRGAEGQHSYCGPSADFWYPFRNCRVIRAASRRGVAELMPSSPEHDLGCIKHGARELAKKVQQYQSRLYGVLQATA